MKTVSYNFIETSGPGGAEDMLITLLRGAPAPVTLLGDWLSFVKDYELAKVRGAELQVV